MPTAMVSSNKDDFFFSQREILDVGYPWYHICPSFHQSSVSPLYHVIFILIDSRELLYLHAFLILRMKGKWEERRSVEHVCYTYTCLKIAGNSTKPFACIFLASDMYVTILPPRESEKASNFIFCLILYFRRQVILIGYFLAEENWGHFSKKEGEWGCCMGN